MPRIQAARAVAAALLAGAAEAAPRTSVSASGLDANTATSCALTKPCRGF